MAVIKFTNSKNSLKGILNYITQAEKTEAKLVSGKDCVAESAFDEMQTVKRMYGKDNGRQYIHLVQSFSPNETLTHQKAHEIGCKLAERFKGFQAVIATHKDRNHIHNHVILNSVNMETGLKFQQSKQQMQQVKDFSDKLCLEYGLSVIKEKSQSKDISRNEYKTAEKGESWKFKLMSTIDNAIEYSQSKAEFIGNMERMGYQVKWQDSHKYITYTTPQGQKCRDNRLHEEKYLKTNMEDFYEHRQLKGFEQAGKFDRRVQYQIKSVRNTAGHAGADINAAVGNRSRADTHASTSESATDMGRYRGNADPDLERYGQQPQQSGQRQRKIVGMAVSESDEQFEIGSDGHDYTQIQRTGADNQSKGTNPVLEKVSVGIAGSDIAANLLGTALAIENLVNQPEEQEQKKYVPKAEKRHNHKKKQSHDREMEMEM